MSKESIYDEGVRIEAVRYPDAVKATRKLMHEVKNTVMNIRTSSANGIRIADADIKKSSSNLAKNQKQYCE